MIEIYLTRVTKPIFKVWVKVFIHGKIVSYKLDKVIVLHENLVSDSLIKAFVMCTSEEMGDFTGEYGIVIVTFMFRNWFFPLFSSIFIVSLSQNIV